MRNQEWKKAPARASAKRQAPKEKSSEQEPEQVVKPAAPKGPAPAPTPDPAQSPEPGATLSGDQGMPSAKAPVARGAAPDGRWQTVRDMGRADRLDAQAERREGHKDTAVASRWDRLGDVRDHRAEEARVEASQVSDPQERAEDLDDAADLQVEANVTHQRAEPLYDSAERRAAAAQGLEARGIDRELVSRHMRGDVSQGAPAAQAVQQSASGQSAVPKRVATGKTRGARVARRSTRATQR